MRDDQLEAASTARETAEVDDAALVAAVVDGNPLAFEVLYRRHKTPLYRTALAFTRDAPAAEELLQEAFLRAFRHMGHVRLDPGASLRPWLHRIVVNLVYDWSERQRRAPGPLDAVAERLLVSPSSMLPERHAEQREVQGIVAEAIEELPFKQRIVVILFYVHDMDLDEVAEVLGLPAGTVKSRLYYARARLRQRLEADVRLPVAMEVRLASV